MNVTFNNDELILTLISLVRATHPAMLREDADGFTVDFEAIGQGKTMGHDERLLLKIRTVLQSQAESAQLQVDLSSIESRRLAHTLAALETLQPWPADVLEMSHRVRKRLKSTE